MALLTTSQFRADFPEFASVVQYPDAQAQFWLDLAQGSPDGTINPLLVTVRWGTMLKYGIELFVAHMLVLAAQQLQAASVGSTPGANTGPVNSQSVGPVSVGFDASAAVLKDAGHWNLTTYGTRFLWLSRMAGAGPIQISGCNGNLFSTSLGVGVFPF